MRTGPFFLRREYVALVPGRAGLDLFRFSVRGGKASLRARHAIPLPEAPDARSEALRRVMTSRKWESLPCVLCLPSHHLAVRCLKPPQRSTESLGHLVQTHSRDFEALSDSRAVTEYAYGAGGARHTLLLFTVREDTLLREVSAVRASGLTLWDVIPFPLAYYEGARQQVSSGRVPFFCVSISEDRCECIAGIGMAVLDVRRLHLSGARPEADTEEDDPVAETPPSDTRRWVEDIAAALREFQASLPEDQGIDALWISGETVLAPALLSHLRREIPVPVKPLDPGDPALLCGGGLSRTFLVGDRSQQVSLLPRDLLAARHRRRSIRIWAAVYGLMAVSLALLTLHASRFNRDLAGRTVQLRGQREAFEALAEERAALAGRMAGLSGTVLPLRDAVRNYPRLARVLEAVQEARDPSDWFVLVADAEAYFSDLSPRRLPPPLGSRISTVIMEGYTPAEDLSSVRLMIEALREQPFIERVDLLPDDQIRSRPGAREAWNLEGLRRFALEIRLRGRPQ